MDFKKTLELIKTEFHKSNVDFALIGGLAVSFYSKPRTTLDVDIIIFSGNFNFSNKVFEAAGYTLEFKSNDIATYLSEDPSKGRIDILIAHRPHAIKMLKNAKIKELFPKCKVKILSPEDLIGLKIQAYNNDNSRYFQDMADIENLMLSKYCKDLKKIKEYFGIFNKLNDYKILTEKLDEKKKK